MPDATLSSEDLKLAVGAALGKVPISFVQLMRALPELRGTEDLAVTPGCILWRGLSKPGVTALRGLHGESAVYFWLCSPTIYTATGNAPFLGLMSSARRTDENVWLPTLIGTRPQSGEEAQKAAREYAAELRRYSVAGF